MQFAWSVVCVVQVAVHLDGRMAAHTMVELSRLFVVYVGKRIHVDGRDWVKLLELVSRGRLQLPNLEQPVVKASRVHVRPGQRQLLGPQLRFPARKQDLAPSRGGQLVLDPPSRPSGADECARVESHGAASNLFQLVLL